MIDFYELPPSPPCRSVKMLARKLDIELNVHIVDIFNKKHLEPDYLKLNPFHKVPAISDNGFHLSESAAIMCYFVNKFDPDSKLYPKDVRERAVVDQMLHTETGSIFPALAGLLRPLVSGNSAPAEAIEKAKDVLSILDKILSNRDFAAGKDLTLADFSLAPTLQSFTVTEVDLKAFPNVDKYLRRVASKLGPIYDEVNTPTMEMMKKMIEEKKK